MDTRDEPEFPRRRRSNQCADGYCGALDCARCYPGNNYQEKKEKAVNKVEAFELESLRARSLGRARELINLLDRAMDIFLSIRNPGDDEAVAKHLLAAIKKIDGARKEAAGIIRRLRNAGLVLLLAFCSIADYGDAQLIDDGVFPVYRQPPAIPGVHGPTVILMPDGGAWTVNPPSMPGHVPAPYYTPPDHRNDSCRPRRLHERSPRYGN